MRARQGDVRTANGIKSYQKTKKKIQIMQNKCIRFCLRLDKMHHIPDEDIRLINWLPIVIYGAIWDDLDQNFQIFNQ